jgi:hypothetical protein
LAESGVREYIWRWLGADVSPQGQDPQVFGYVSGFLPHKGQCQVTMHDYIDGILKAYDLAIKDHNDGYEVAGKHHYKMSTTPDNLFVVNEDCKKLSNEAAAGFHIILAKALYVTKEARPDISLAIAFLATRVRSPNADDWEKLSHQARLNT